MTTEDTVVDEAPVEGVDAAPEDGEGFIPPFERGFYKEAQMVLTAHARRLISDNEARFNLIRCGMTLWEDTLNIPDPPAPFGDGFDDMEGVA